MSKVTILTDLYNKSVQEYTKDPAVHANPYGVYLFEIAACKKTTHSCGKCYRGTQTAEILIWVASQ